MLIVDLCKYVTQYTIHFCNCIQYSAVYITTYYIYVKYVTLEHVEYIELCFIAWIIQLLLHECLAYGTTEVIKDLCHMKMYQFGGYDKIVPLIIFYIFFIKEGKPVTIVAVESGYPKMDTAALAKVLEDVKQLPLIIVSMIGRARGGKSFLLTLYMNYLNYLEKVSML